MNDFRNELAKYFHSENKFQLNFNDNPIDFLFFILNSIHSYTVNAYSLKNVSERKCKPKCVTHNYLKLEIIEEIVKLIIF